MHNPRVWIITPGRTGSSVLQQIMQRCGFDIGKSSNSEYIPVTDLNDKLLGPYKDTWMYKILSPEMVAKMRDGLVDDFVKDRITSLSGKLPELVKDPRWSVTLPVWLSCKFLNLPDYVFSLHRDPEQCCLSWMNVLGMKKEELVNVRINLKQRTGLLDNCCSILGANGVNVYHLHYPQFLTTERQRLHMALTGILFPGDTFEQDAYMEQCETVSRRVYRAMEDIIKTEEIHTYAMGSRSKV